MESPTSSSPQRLSPWYNDFVPCTWQDKLLASSVQVETSVLCSKCELIRGWVAEHWTRLQIVNENFEQVFNHYDDSRLLEPSALRGCHLCTLFWHDFDPKIRARRRLAEREELHTEIRRGRQVRVTAYNKGLSGPVIQPSLSIPGSYSLSGWPTSLGPSTHFQLRPETDISMAVSKLSSLHVSTACPAANKLAKAWIAECVTSHPKCARKRTSTLPTRLVDVRSLETIGKVRTVETNGMHLDSQYVALSYCWGPTPTFKLTKSTWKSLTLGVVVEQLPKSIQDAIYFTQRIGLGWLWVDSLCIIQDSEEDWNREASAMCEVYLGSFLTIAALGAANSGGGLFAVRDPLLYSPCFMFQTNQQQQIYAGQDSAIGVVLDPWPLHQRGWVTQERILPRRTLNFGPYLIWKCHEKTLDEYNIIARSNYKFGFHLSSAFCEFVIDGAIHDVPSTTRDMQILGIWQEIIVSFTRGELTVMTDRLTAISGVLAGVQRRTGWTNLSGLWEPFLWRQILWKKSAASSGLYTPITGLLPSWSWIAVNGPIVWEPDEDGFFMNPVAHVRRTSDIKPSKMSRNMAPRMALEILCIPGRIASTARFCTKLTDWPIAVDGNYKRDIRGTDRQPELFLPIGAGVRSKSYLEIHGLGVSPSRTCDGAFERIGYFTFKTDKESDAALRESNYAILHNLDLRKKFILV